MRNRRAANAAGLGSIGVSLYILYFTLFSGGIYTIQSAMSFYAGLIIIPRLRPKAIFKLLGEITLVGRILGRLIWVILAGIAVVWAFWFT